jgi:hypothetical protein
LARGILAMGWRLAGFEVVMICPKRRRPGHGSIGIRALNKDHVPRSTVSVMAEAAPYPVRSRAKPDSGIGRQ